MYESKLIFNILKYVQIHVKPVVNLNRVITNTTRYFVSRNNTYINYSSRFYALKCRAPDFYTEHYNKYYKKKNINIFLGMSATFFGLFGSHEEEEGEIPKLIMTIKRSILLTQKGEFKKAEQMLHIALRQAQTLQHYDAITYIYDLMANLAFDVGEYEKAQKLFVSVLQRILSKGVQQNDLKIIHISLKLANSLEHLGDLEKADDGYKYCLKHLEEQYFNNPEDIDVALLWVMTLEWYGKFFLSQSKYAQALKYLLQAHDLCVKINGEEHEQTVLLLNSLGVVSSMQGEDDKALEYFSNAVKIGKTLPDEIDLSAIHINIGLLLIKKGLYDDAKQSCNEGWRLSNNLNNDESREKANDCLIEIKKHLS